MEIPSELESRGYCVKAHRAYAVLRYEGALSTLPEDFDSQYNPSERCNSTKQCYAINCPFMNYPDNVFTTCINFDQTIHYQYQAMMSRIQCFSTFKQECCSKFPILRRSTIPDYITENDIDEDSFCEYSQDLSGDNRANCLHTYTATTETVELVLSNVADSDFSSHPVHIHGHYFHVLHVGYPDYNVEGQLISKNQDLNCIPPTMDSAIRVCHGLRSPTPIFLSRVRHLPSKGHDNYSWWVRKGAIYSQQSRLVAAPLSY